jgi:hypothetical protein
VTAAVKVGDRVRCHRDEPYPATWQRWQGRNGTVIVASRHEIGLSFDNTANIDAWFLPSEVLIQAPQRPVASATVGTTP